MTAPSVQYEAAQLLRTAETLTATRGHTRESYINPRTGALCMEGALRAASGHVYYVENANLFAIGNRPGPTLDADRDVLRIATRALISLLPEKCDVPGHGHGCPYGSSLENKARIHHYNDFVCTGGEDAQLLFLQAAEKIEADL